MNPLYPLKFSPIFKEKIWGGQKINTILGKKIDASINCGESWEISAVEGNVSVVEEGGLKGWSLTALIKQYKDQLVGKKVYAMHGDEFPLLIKFLDANEDLSIQVHPNDELASVLTNASGKTEMWYVIQADEGAKINLGFNKTITEEEYLYHLNQNTLDQLLNYEYVLAGDALYIPGRKVHYIGKGCCIAEIQQTSDTTYRIYDFDRVDSEGNKRALHTEEALKCIDFNAHTDHILHYSREKNSTHNLVHCIYFTTNIISIDKPLTLDYTAKDSFVILICVEGNVTLKYNEKEEIVINTGDTYLIPNNLKILALDSANATLLEVYIN
ncbi:MAG: hypothetical protein RL711_611 [Bacteroidota bacterium]|jgi:mannose-6-phosphate isomerase